MANPWDFNWKKVVKKEVQKPKEDGPWNMAWTDLKSTGKKSPVDEVFSQLNRIEGRGDKVTSVKTGNLGVTKWARDAVGATEKDSDEDVAKKYLEHLNKVWESKEGYSKAPIELRSALLDSSYNMGTSVMSNKNVLAGLSGEDYSRIGKYILSTANVGGKSMKGLALRRAEMFNKFSEEKIVSVAQGEDGTLKYFGKDDKEIFSYKPKGGRHAKSNPGTAFID